PTNPDPPAMPPPMCTHDGLCAPPEGVEPEKTYVEWDLMDLNGDGYPDFVFNSRTTEFEFSWPHIRDHDVALTVGHFQLPVDNRILAAFNIVGVRLQENEPNPSFAQSVSLSNPGEIFGVGL